MKDQLANNLIEFAFFVVLILIGFGVIAAGCWGCQVECYKDTNHYVNPAWCKER